MFLNSFHYFRALAIVIIIAGHSYNIGPWKIDTFFENLISQLVTGGTFLFVFISGFLFNHIFVKKFQYRKFMTNKLKNVALPYAILSIVPVCYWVFIRHTGPQADAMFIHDGSLYGEYVRPFLLYYLTGNTMLQFWYIPFILTVFLLSPAYLAYIRLPANIRWITFVVLVGISYSIGRPYANLNPFHSALFFSSMYCFGILCSLHYDSMLNRLRGHEGWLLLGALAMASIQALNSGVGPEQWQKLPIYNLLPTTILQKLFLCLFMMVFLSRFEKREYAWLAWIADASFAIYFLHMFVVEGLQLFSPYNAGPIPDMLVWIGFTTLVFGLCTALVIILRKVLGKHSRLFIGS